LADPTGPTGTVSLRQAIVTANADTIDSQEVINFTPGLCGTIDLTTALPNLANNISINGPEASYLTVPAIMTVQRDSNAAQFSVFTVNSGETANISRLMISGGDALYGGGILNNGTLAVTNCIIANNTAPATTFGYGEGGGIYNEETIALTGCSFQNNFATWGGGGLDNDGIATLSQSIFTGNSTGYSGGGIYNDGALTIGASTFTGNSATDSGGGINNDATLVVTDSQFTDNTASGGSLYGNGEGYVTSSLYGGGAIYSGGTITIVNNTFTGNTTNGDGGGIYTSGTATVTNGVFTANEAACAGGIFNNGVLTVNNSTFANSTGAFYGGGIWNASFDGGGSISQLATLSVTNCVFTNNAVDGWCSAGSGIFGDGSGAITVSNSTFANNSTNGLYNGGGITGGSPLTITNCTIVDNSGGGINNNNMTINNTIVAGNTGYDVSGQITGYNNLIGNGTGITNLSSLNTSNLVGTTANPINPLLGLLQNNGGPTDTIALLQGSLAINAGSNILAVDANGYPLLYDQRGVGYPRTTNNTVDIGAYEHMQTTPMMATVSVTAIPGLVYNGTSQETVSYTATGINGVILPSSDFTDTTVHTNAGTYTDQWTFTDPNYISQYGPVTDAIAPAPFTVTVTAPTIPYGNTPTFIVTGSLPTGVTETTTILNPLYSTSGHLDAGVYSLQTVLSGPVDNNYAPNIIDGRLTVNPTSVIASFTVANKIYDGTNTATVINTPLTNVVSGDWVYLGMGFPAVWNSATFSNPNVGTWAVNITTAALTGPDAANYTLQSVVPTTATITPAKASIVVGSYPFSIGPLGNILVPAIFNGEPYIAAGTVGGVNGGLPSSDLNLNGTIHTNAGTYHDTWTFSDPSGNYVSQSGTVTDVITNPPPMALITVLYQEILGRAPDQAGITTWVNAVNSGSTVNSIATSFWNSPEHKANPIGNKSTAIHDAETAFVSALYLDMLGRTGDTGGVTCWDQVLNSNNTTPNQVTMAFWNSPEHQAKLGTVLYDSYDYVVLVASSYGGTVDALYHELLGRGPDQCGLNSWVNIQYSGAQSQDQMVQSFASSPEFMARTSKLSTNQFVTSLYNNILHRAPDAAGLAAWDLALNSGTVTRTQAVLGFWDSPEHAQEL